MADCLGIRCSIGPTASSEGAAHTGLTVPQRLPVHNGLDIATGRSGLADPAGVEDTTRTDVEIRTKSCNGRSRLSLGKVAGRHILRRRIVTDLLLAAVVLGPLAIRSSKNDNPNIFDARWSKE